MEFIIETEGERGDFGLFGSSFIIKVNLFDIGNECMTYEYDFYGIARH